MKKITLIIALAITTSTLFAQTGNSYLMMNFGIGRNLNYGYWNRGTHIPLGLQYIKGAKNNTAYRFGFNFSSTNFTKFHQGYYSNDTFYNSNTDYYINTANLSFGKEWRKQIHKDISIYAGADLGVGLGKSYSNTNNNRMIKDSMGGYYNIGGYGFGQRNVALNITARPFIGIRTDWNQFVVGYEASLPVNYTHVFGQNSNNVNGFRLQHQLSLGYKLGKKKK